MYLSSSLSGCKSNHLKSLSLITAHSHYILRFLSSSLGFLLQLFLICLLGIASVDSPNPSDPDDKSLVKQVLDRFMLRSLASASAGNASYQKSRKDNASLEVKQDSRVLRNNKSIKGKAGEKTPKSPKYGKSAPKYGKSAKSSKKKGSKSSKSATPAPVAVTPAPVEPTPAPVPLTAPPVQPTPAPVAPS